MTNAQDDTALQPVTHICLVSDQLAPNFIPTLKYRPHRVVLLASERMQEKARRLRDVMRKTDALAGMRVDIWERPIADHDIARISADAEELFSYLFSAQSDRPEQFIMNATGGNKLMTLGYWKVLGELLHGVLYCDTSHGTIEWLTKTEPRTDALGQVLDIRLCLAINGYRIKSTKPQSEDPEWRERAKARKQLTKELARRLPAAGEFLGRLNDVASSAKESFKRKDLHGARQKYQFDDRRHARDCMDLIADPAYRLIDRDLESQCIVFSGEDAARYLSGAWLEEFTFWSAHDAGAHDVAAGVTVNFKGTETSNELDVAVVHNNRLLVVECKAANFNEGDGKAQDVLHKLENVTRQTGGAFAEAWVVSARTLPDETRLRARNYGIQVIEGDEISTLSSRFKQWLGTA